LKIIELTQIISIKTKQKTLLTNPFPKHKYAVVVQWLVYGLAID